VVDGWLHVSTALDRFGGAEFRLRKAARASRRITSNQSNGGAGESRAQPICSRQQMKRALENSFALDLGF
jgi:hypothetical protein